MKEKHSHSVMAHNHHHEINEKTISKLGLSFILNILLSVIEIIASLISGSVALLGDALHNTSDAFSILIAIIAFKIGRKKINKQYTYGFQRAEIIGGLVNLILLFISGTYLLFEGVKKIINPEIIDGKMIILVSVVALFIDGLTAMISHHGAKHNTNMKMVFIHNLADAFGSIGVIVSGLCVVYFHVYFIDGIIALLIAAYMLFQSIVSFPKIVRILMNATPENLDIDVIKKEILLLKDVEDVHHIHVWSINEYDISMECHIVSKNLELVHCIPVLVKEKFGISHCMIQIEQDKCCSDCVLSTSK